MTSAKDILDFWFSADPKLWFSKDDGFDAAIRSRFAPALAQARAGALGGWEDEIEGMLALVIVLDQFSRNLHRGSAEAFSHDAQALALSHRLVEHPEFDQLSAVQKQFAVMPMMHAEDLEEQRRCLALMQRIGIKGAIDAAQTHLEIVARFGRFPHRNAVLGRQTSAAEQAFLDEGGFAG